MIDVDVETGKLNITDQIITEIETYAQRFATGHLIEADIAY